MTIDAEMVAHYEAFGFLHVKNLLRPAEIEQVKTAANTAWRKEQASGIAPGGQNLLKMMDTDAAPYTDRYHSWWAEFIETHPQLHWLAADERTCGLARRLFGGGAPVWVGSEGNWNRGFASTQVHT